MIFTGARLEMNIFGMISLAEWKNSAEDIFIIHLWKNSTFFLVLPYYDKSTNLYYFERRLHYHYIF